MRDDLVRRLVVAAVGVLALLVPAATALLPPEGRGAFERDCLAVGAWVESWGPAFPEEAFGAADEALGPLTVRRSFDKTLPATFAASAAAGDAAAGVHTFLSWKPPGGDHRGAAAGLYDQQIAAWARSVPTADVHATAFHEPENDMTAAEFVAFHRHVYRVVKAANTSIRWGPVYMAYWWDPAAPDHYVGDPAAWWPGDRYADFVGLDWYGVDPEPMTTSPSFRHWHELMSPTGLPLIIAEYGQALVGPGEALTPADAAARAAAIREDAAWIAEHPQVAAWMYWHGPGPHGDWHLSDEQSRRAWREVAASGCSS